MEIDRKRLAIEEAKMPQQVDLDLAKRVGIGFGPYGGHVLYLIRGLRTDAEVS